MDQILVLNENQLECGIIQTILSNGLESAEIILAPEEGAAMELLRERDVDLLIADVPRFDLRHCNMMAQARQLSPDTPILVTSVGVRSDIAPHVWRLGLQDYLLKPCRPAWFLAAVQALKRDNSIVSDNREEQRLEPNYTFIMYIFMERIKVIFCNICAFFITKRPHLFSQKL